MIRKLNKSNRNGIFIFSDPNDFLQAIEQLEKEYKKNNNGEKTNDENK